MRSGRRTVESSSGLPAEPLRVLLLGRPGSGKGTQGGAVSEILGVPHVSTGALLRAEIEAGTPLGHEVERFVTAGRLVPDVLVSTTLAQRLARDDVRARGFLLDGFPRSVAQAAALEREIAPARLDVAVELLLSEREAAHRLNERFVCELCAYSPTRLATGEPALPDECGLCGGALRRRADDAADAIRRRFEEYERLTKPLLEWLDQRRLLVTVDADRPAAEITSSLVDALRGRSGGERLLSSPA